MLKVPFKIPKIKFIISQFRSNLKMDFNEHKSQSTVSSKPFVETDKPSSPFLNDIDKYTYFMEKPHKNLYCPVCFNLYRNPVLIDCSHTICNLCISKTVSSDQDLSLKKCPLDGKNCTIKLQNKNIEEQIDDLLIRYI